MSQSPGGATQVDLVISGTQGLINVGGNVESAMIVRKVAPHYPPAAKAAGVQGVVHLSATIGTDGTVQQLDVLDGPAELIQAATDAVKQWVYKPTLLNSNPVQVQTTIDINFTLNK
jgi:protein TonB